jgi:hypothetical protein
MGAADDARGQSAVGAAAKFMVITDSRHNLQVHPNLASQMASKAVN